MRCGLQCKCVARFFRKVRRASTLIQTRFWVYWAGFVILIGPSRLPAQTSSVSFSIPTGATADFISGDASGPLNTGFARILPGFGNTVPEAFAISQYRAKGILVSEYTVPASQPD